MLGIPEISIGGGGGGGSSPSNAQIKKYTITSPMMAGTPYTFVHGFGLSNIIYNVYDNINKNYVAAPTIRTIDGNSFEITMDYDTIANQIIIEILGTT